MNETLTAEVLDLEVDELIQIPDTLPVLPLRDVVLFPFSIIPLSVARETSMRAVDRALGGTRLVLLLTQRDATIELPTPDDLYSTGCVGAITRILKLPDGTTRILVQGVTRAAVDYFTRTEPHLEARLRRYEEPVPDDALQAEVHVRSIRQALERITALGRHISPEVMLIAANLESPLRLADLTAANLGLKVEDAQRVLESVQPAERLELVTRLAEREVAMLEMQQHISARAQDEMDRGQREYFLRQQLKAIQKELGEGDDLEREIATYVERADTVGLTQEARTEVDTQLRRLRTMHPESAESGVIRTWLDWITSLPWARTSEDVLDLALARRILDEDHYDLDKVKERILEFLAVRTLRPEGKGPILCFVGPPGVGKTSLGKSIARAMDRRFVRTSLGAIRDEAEIRGHRRTYVGALPGRVIQGIHQAETSNPVFMLDEVDKLGADFRGDPSSALLEVLDPEQNDTFRDHYLGVVYDLSRVLFIATANTTDGIQPAFLDRMEVIRLSGYSEEEKIEIARGHLIPRQVEANGLADRPPELSAATLEAIIRGWTDEAGVRNLERQIGAVCRKIAVRVAEKRRAPRRITPASVERMLGPRPYLSEDRLREDKVGVATGLAFTATGGEILLVEALVLPGASDLKLTGSLGEVMRESATAAQSLARARASAWGVDPKFFDSNGFHIHVPAGGVPKDGPSAGITLLTTMISAASGRPVRHDLAMTGEITLRGEVLPVGGVKEKILAALRAGITELILPAPNERDLVDLSPRARRRVRVHLVRTVEDVLEKVLR